MKLEGSLLSPRKFSSLKYDMTCVACFQKFIVSCSPNQISAVVPRRPACGLAKGRFDSRGIGEPYLVLGVVLQEKDVDDGDLVDESVLLELLSHPRPNRRDGHGDVVHPLDVGRLSTVAN